MRLVKCFVPRSASATVSNERRNTGERTCNVPNFLCSRRSLALPRVVRASPRRDGWSASRSALRRALRQALRRGRAAKKRVMPHCILAMPFEFHSFISPIGRSETVTSSHITCYDWVRVLYATATNSRQSLRHLQMGIERPSQAILLHSPLLGVWRLQRSSK